MPSCPPPTRPRARLTFCCALRVVRFPWKHLTTRLQLAQFLDLTSQSQMARRRELVPVWAVARSGAVRMPLWEPRLAAVVLGFCAPRYGWEYGDKTRGELAAELATASGREEELAYLLRIRPVGRAAAEAALLHACVEGASEEAVRLLVLEGGARADARGGAAGWTAAATASYHGHDPVAEALAELGADTARHVRAALRG